MLDINKAFNKVLYKRLNKMAVIVIFPLWLYSWLVLFLKGRTVHFKFNNKISLKWPIQLEVP